MEQLRLFAVSSVTKPPVEFIRKKDKQIFTCTVTLPIPPQLLIFQQGQWPPGKDKNVTLDIYLDSDKIGEMEEDTKCFNWEADSLKDRPAGDKILLEVKVIGMKTPTEPCQLPKTRNRSVRKKANKTTSPPEHKDKPSPAQEEIEKEHEPLADIPKKINTEAKDEENSKAPEKSKDEKSSIKDGSNSGKTKAGQKKKNTSNKTTEEKKSTPSTTGLKKTRQTQLNFSGTKKVLSVSNTPEKDEQSETSKNESLLDLEAAEMTETALDQKEQKKPSSPKPTVPDEDVWSHVQLLNENTPQIGDMPSPLPRKPMKKRRRSDLENTPQGPTPKKRGTRMRALTSDGTPKSCRSKKAILADSPFKENIMTPLGDDQAAQHSDGCLTQCVDLTARAPRPSARWGHTMLLTQPRCAVLIGGQGDRQQLSRDSVWTLHTETRKWECQEVQSEGQKPENRMGHTATYDPTMRCVYIFGGSKNSRWFHDVHMYDLEENKWTLTKVDGKAPTRAYHTANLHRHELWIFGGVYPRPDPNPDGCSNEIHIFSPVMKSWYSPIVQGDKPLPRSGHSATLIKDRLVMFGGWDSPFCYNDLFILDMKRSKTKSRDDNVAATVDWSEPEVKGTPPKPRSWHASCALSNQRILIHGGYDGNEALHDSFVFDLDGLSWSQLVISDFPKARAGHAAVSLPYSHDNQEEDEVLVFGGGDNDGEFFSNLLAFTVPFNPVVHL